MYNVMLVDDDYPVLQLLSETINWEAYGLQLQGCYENGAVALEHATIQMPDILITDIGMPLMNGIELIGLLKEQKPNLRVAILSCHSEFHYAQQAMKLNVQEYVLKDTLDPADLEKLLLQFKVSLDQEEQVQAHQHQLQHMVDRNKELLKEKFIRRMMQQPIIDPQDWLLEAKAFNLDMEGKACLPILGFVDEYRLAKHRFMSDDILRFAMDNVISEVCARYDTPEVHFAYGIKESFFLYPYHATLKINPFDTAIIQIKAIQDALLKYLKISMSFIIGDICYRPDEIKLALNGLLSSTVQRFYVDEGSITKQRPFIDGDIDLFSWYDQASKEFREMMIEKKADRIIPTVKHWMEFLKEHSFPPEKVKDWVLKLLLDLKLKLQSLQYFRSTYAVESLHKEILDIDSLVELEHWLIEHFQSVIALAGEIWEQSKRTEVVQACHYVSLHLDKRISLEEVADHLFLNSSYFSRLFKKETGETFIEYVTRMKMIRAKELLDQTSHPVGKICEMLGYDNQSYFIKIFKASEGVTPVEYRGQKIT
ncbi:response regulator transcription factor [Paenibacillus radicis (ex Xue et al. 2023)]|uniref:AraC family transcriptional regulator n=1 Tax=Paenibacillus radicis (ex Xue et al. 2023) TaxID=2972489 RepID=A0ABT1YLD1_9BACL|nr:helix-turn-helix domain-containing protein [Paenibacillus radicis (ex Xue et al. 2023)]MCR8633991.1 AraC family transcriptional regulator [Paenibacillus radicis (ex Xue et al. 2023)]